MLSLSLDKNMVSLLLMYFVSLVYGPARLETERGIVSMMFLTIQKRHGKCTGILNNQNMIITCKLVRSIIQWSWGRISTSKRPWWTVHQHVFEAVVLSWFCMENNNTVVNQFTIPFFRCFVLTSYWRNKCRQWSPERQREWSDEVLTDMWKRARTSVHGKFGKVLVLVLVFSPGLLLRLGQACPVSPKGVVVRIS
jgi:hypothetical protein